jgi:hypothetical protein
VGIHRTSAPATRRKGSCACAWRYLSTMPTASCSPIAAGRSSVIFDAYRIGEGELSVTRDPLQVLSAFEVGIPNVVAFLSAITARSLDLLARRSSGHAALSHVLAGMPERYTDFGTAYGSHYMEHCERSPSPAKATCLIQARRRREGRSCRVGCRQGCARTPCGHRQGGRLHRSSVVTRRGRQVSRARSTAGGWARRRSRRR